MVSDAPKNLDIVKTRPIFSQQKFFIAKKKFCQEKNSCGEKKNVLSLRIFFCFREHSSKWVIKEF